MKDLTYQEKKTIVEQFQHANATPLILNEMEEAVVGGIRHVFEMNARAVRVIEALEAENKALRLLCKQHKLAVPRKTKL